MVRHVICGRLCYQPQYHHDVRVYAKCEKGESEKVFICRAITLRKESVATVHFDHHVCGFKERNCTYTYRVDTHMRFRICMVVSVCISIGDVRMAADVLNFAAVFPEHDF
jgi:hypothetical protein